MELPIVESIKLTACVEYTLIAVAKAVVAGGATGAVPAMLARAPSVRTLFGRLPHTALPVALLSALPTDTLRREVLSSRDVVDALGLDAFWHVPAAATNPLTIVERHSRYTVASVCLPCKHGHRII